MKTTCLKRQHSFVRHFDKFFFFLTSIRVYTRVSSNVEFEFSENHPNIYTSRCARLYSRLKVFILTDRKLRGRGRRKIYSGGPVIVNRVQQTYPIEIRLIGVLLDLNFRAFRPFCSAENENKQHSNKHSRREDLLWKQRSSARGIFPTFVCGRDRGANGVRRKNRDRVPRIQNVCAIFRQKYHVSVFVICGHGY